MKNLTKLNELVEQYAKESGLSTLEVLTMVYDDTGLKYEGVNTSEDVLEEMVQYFEDAE